MVLGVTLLLGLFRVFVTTELISAVFTGELFRDTVIEALIGSSSAGNSIASYVIGGELLKEGVSLFAVAHSSWRGLPMALFKSLSKLR